MNGQGTLAERAAFHRQCIAFGEHVDEPDFPGPATFHEAISDLFDSLEDAATLGHHFHQLIDVVGWNGITDEELAELDRHIAWVDHVATACAVAAGGRCVHTDRAAVQAAMRTVVYTMCGYELLVGARHFVGAMRSYEPQGDA